MWWYLLYSWLFLVLFFWFLVYGASLYDRRNSTARHRADQPALEQLNIPDELDEVLNAMEKDLALGA